MTDSILIALAGAALSGAMAWGIAKAKINGMAAEIMALREFRHEIAGKFMALWMDFEKRKGK